MRSWSDDPRRQSNGAHHSLLNTSCKSPQPTFWSMMENPRRLQRQHEWVIAWRVDNDLAKEAELHIHEEDDQRQTRAPRTCRTSTWRTSRHSPKKSSCTFKRVVNHRQASARTRRTPAWKTRRYAHACATTQWSRWSPWKRSSMRTPTMACLADSAIGATSIRISELPVSSIATWHDAERRMARETRVRYLSLNGYIYIYIYIYTYIYIYVILFFYTYISLHEWAQVFLRWQSVDAVWSCSRTCSFRHHVRVRQRAPQHVVGVRQHDQVIFTSLKTCSCSTTCPCSTPCFISYSVCLIQYRRNAATRDPHKISRAWNFRKKKNESVSAKCKISRVS